MARFLFASWPIYGHLCPAIEIARGLRERGHEAAIYTGKSVQPLVTREGLLHFPFIRVDEARFTALVYSEDRSFNAKRPVGLMGFLRSLLTDFAGDQVADLIAIIALWRPDVIVCDVMMWGPLLVVKEAFGIPVAVLSTAAGCTVPGPEGPLWGTGLPPPRTALTRLRAGLIQHATDFLARDIRRCANELRSAYGLTPLRTSVTAYLGTVERYLVCSVPELDYHRTDLPESVRYVGPMTQYRPSIGTTSSWFNTTSSDTPLVHVTEGTMQARPQIILAAIRGLANMGARVLITTGTNRTLTDLNIGPLASNIHVEQFVPHDQLLPKTALVVTQGGAGTMFSALAHGVPLLIVPAESDQHDNATRILQVGAGLRIARRACSPDRLRRTVEHMLATPSFRRQAQRFPEIFSEYRGASTAVSVLQEMEHGCSNHAHGDSCASTTALPKASLGTR